MRIVITIALILIFQSCLVFKRGTSREYAQNHIAKLDSNFADLKYDGEIFSKREAIKVGKDSVYDVFGFWHINLRERPYRKHFIGNYLYLSGTLSKRKSGGSFWVIVDRRNGEIIQLSHGK